MHMLTLGAKTVLLRNKNMTNSSLVLFRILLITSLLIFLNFFLTDFRHDKALELAYYADETDPTEPEYNATLKCLNIENIE